MKELTYTTVAKEDFFFCPNPKQTYYAKANLLEGSTPATAFIPSYTTDSPGIKSLQFLPSLFIFFLAFPSVGAVLLRAELFIIHSTSWHINFGFGYQSKDFQIRVRKNAHWKVTLRFKHKE